MSLPKIKFVQLAQEIINRLLPTGGTTGQVPVKQANGSVLYQDQGGHAHSNKAIIDTITQEDLDHLDSIAPNATANASDAQLRDRSTHTGTQAISTVTGLQTALNDKATSAQGAKADTAVQPDAATTFSAPQRAGNTTDNDGNLDLNTKNDFLCTPAAPFTLDFSNRATGQRGMIYLNNTGAHDVTAGADIEGPNGWAAAVSAAGKYMISYWCIDGTKVGISYVKVS